MANPPEYRPYRAAVLVAYIAVTVLFSASVAASVFLGARARSGKAGPLAPLESVDASRLAACVDELELLYAELNERIEAAIASSRARITFEDWEAWSPAWRERLVAVGARCRLAPGDAPGSAPVKAAYDGLVALHRHYSTLTVQFSKEIGPSVDRLKAAMEKARESVEH